MAYVMIIDDDEDMASAVATMLQNAGHEVDIELDHKKAVTCMEERCPDLLILDVMFPNEKTAGFTLAREMRLHNERLKDIPIIMFTAVNQEYQGLHFSNLDIDDHWLPVAEFLDKPVDPSVLREKVSTLLAGKNVSAGGVDKEACDDKQ